MSRTLSVLGAIGLGAGLGVAATALGRSEPVESADDILHERVRSKLDRWVSNPHAIAVLVDEGVVTMEGPVLASEVERMVIAIGRMAGVLRIENRLVVHRTADIPALQAGDRAPGEPFEFLQASGSPTVRVLAGVIGSLLTIGGLRRGGPGLPLAALGVGLIAGVAIAPAPVREQVS